MSYRGVARMGVSLVMVLMLAWLAHTLYPGLLLGPPSEGGPLEGMLMVPDLAAETRLPPDVLPEETPPEATEQRPSAASPDPGEFSLPPADPSPAAAVTTVASSAGGAEAGAPEPTAGGEPGLQEGVDVESPVQEAGPVELPSSSQPHNHSGIDIGLAALDKLLVSLNKSSPILLALANGGFVEMTMNFLCSLRRLGLEHRVVLLVD
eukprot:RCo011368